MSKGYTINYYAEQVKTLTNKQIENDVYAAISPRGGYLSEKSIQFDEFLGGDTSEIIAGFGVYSTFGKTAKTRLLTALKNRKANGSVKTF